MDIDKIREATWCYIAESQHDWREIEHSSGIFGKQGQETPGYSKYMCWDCGLTTEVWKRPSPNFQI